MLSELKGAFKDVFSNNIKWLVVLTVLSTAAVFAVLFFGLTLIFDHFSFIQTPWIEKTVEIFGYIAFFIMSLMLFPVVATSVSGFFIDSLIERCAKKEGVSGLRVVPLSESIRMAGGLAIKGVGTSVVLIPATFLLGLIPFANLVPLVLYYGVNGKLLGREYFFAVSSRYLEYDKSQEMFNRFAAYWTRAGILIALMMTLPVVNIVSPLVAAAFMRRLFLKKKEKWEKQ